MKGGAIATLSNVQHILDPDRRDLLKDEPLFRVVFTLWGYENLDNLNRVLDDRGIHYSFNKIDYDAGEFTYSVKIREIKHFQLIKDILKEKNLDWRVEE